MGWFLSGGYTSFLRFRGERGPNAVINQLGSGIRRAWVSCDVCEPCDLGEVEPPSPHLENGHKNRFPCV